MYPMYWVDFEIQCILKLLCQQGPLFIDLTQGPENVWTGPGHCLANFARAKRCINTCLGSGPDVIST
jgi:hypothetical protein